MSTVLTPVGISSITSIRLLSNLMGSSLALELVPGQITTMGPDKLLFYDTVVDSNSSSATYNLDTITNLVSDGILGDSTITLIDPTPQVKIVPGGTFVAGVTSNKNVKVSAKEYNQSSNHLEICPAVDENGKLLAIYYRDAEGISYSLNGGLSSVLIDNTNLLYPDEITSMSVQIYDSVLALKPIVKLFIGTLREGIKTFTPGVDTTFQQFNNSGTYASGAAGQLYYFKNSVKSADGSTNIGLGYAPIYILGILNFTLNNGCPLVVYSRTFNNGAANFNYCTINLHSKTYSTTTVNGVAKKTLVTTVPAWNINSYNLSVGNIVDVISSIDCSRSLVSGTVSTKLVGIKTVADNALTNEFILFNSTDSTISTVLLPPAPATLRNEYFITGLSYFSDPVTGNSSIFVTTDESVWVYTNSTWSIFISSLSDTSTVLTRALSTGLTASLQPITTNVTPTTYLTGLTGFSVAQIPDVAGFYIGYMGSNIGILQYQFACISGNLVVKDSSTYPAKQLRTDLFSSCSTVAIPSQTNIILSCGLKTAVPFRYDVAENTTYFYYIPNDSISFSTQVNGTTATEYFSRSNYLVSDGTHTEGIANFYNENTYLEFDYIPSDQFIDTTSLDSPSLKLKSTLASPVMAAEYEQKFLAFINNPTTSPTLPNDQDLYLYLKMSESYNQKQAQHQNTYTKHNQPELFSRRTQM